MTCNRCGTHECVCYICIVAGVSIGTCVSVCNVDVSVGVVSDVCAVGMVDNGGVVDDGVPGCDVAGIYSDSISVDVGVVVDVGVGVVDVGVADVFLL